RAVIRASAHAVSALPAWPLPARNWHPGLRYAAVPPEESSWILLCMPVCAQTELHLRFGLRPPRYRRGALRWALAVLRSFRQCLSARIHRGFRRAIRWFQGRHRWFQPGILVREPNSTVGSQPMRSYSERHVLPGTPPTILVGWRHHRTDGAVDGCSGRDSARTLQSLLGDGRRLVAGVLGSRPDRDFRRFALAVVACGTRQDLRRVVSAAAGAMGMAGPTSLTICLLDRRHRALALGRCEHHRQHNRPYGCHHSGGRIRRSRNGRPCLAVGPSLPPLGSLTHAGSLTPLSAAKQPIAASGHPQD